MELDWPVGRGGVVVVQPDDERFAWRAGTEEDDRFPIASVTKLHTSLAALAAVEAGRIGLDDDVPLPDDLPARRMEAVAGAGSVTLRHLLAHAGGLPQEDGGALQPPGERRIYSNPGFRLLARALERAVAVPFADWLDRSVLRPLALTRTELDGWSGVPGDPAAGIVCTLPELALLAGCLLDRGAPVIGPELFAEAVQVQFPGLAGVVPGLGRFDPCDWGLGVELKDGKAPHWMGAQRAPSSFGHFGASGCFLWVDPEAGVAAAAATDRPFADGGWALRAWPAWSDQVTAPPG
jgi:CubicO group peptidase (beta-lactamase class C family)